MGGALEGAEALLDDLEQAFGETQLALSERADTKFVGLTSSDSEEASLDMLRAGAKSFLLKGASRDEIVTTILDSLRF